MRFKSQIKEVSIDLSGSYRGLIRKVLPSADIVADIFHVMKLVNEELNRARNTENRVINELKDEAKKEEFQAVFKHSKYAVLKPEERLTEQQKFKLEEVKQAFPKLAEMHRQKESFRTIFEDACILDRWSIQAASLALKMLRICFGIVQLQ